MSKALLDSGRKIAYSCSWPAYVVGQGKKVRMLGFEVLNMGEQGTVSGKERGMEEGRNKEVKKREKSGTRD